MPDFQRLIRLSVKHAVGLRSCATGVARSLDVRCRRAGAKFGNAGPDVTIGRAAADHEGARPYRRHVLEPLPPRSSQSTRKKIDEDFVESMSLLDVAEVSRIF